jgi:hypothetical protein
MAEIGASKVTTGQNLIRTIDSMFDKNVFFTNQVFDTSFTSGIPVEVLETRGRLLERIADISVSTVLVEPPEWLAAEIYTLRQRIQMIEERLATIETTIPKEKVVVLRALSKKEAEKEILTLFTAGQTLYYSDIAEQLRLDLKLVVEICNELQRRGEIEVVDDTLQRR